MSRADPVTIGRGLAKAIFIAAFLSALSPARSKAAGEPVTRVVLLAKEPSESLPSRVSAELRSLGFEVVSVGDDDATKSPTQLEAVARSSEALAAVRVVAVEGAVDLWIVNVRTHEIVVRRVVSPDPTVAALRSVEALRASLIDLLALAPKTSTPHVPREAAAEVTGIPPLAKEHDASRLGFELALGPAHATEYFDPSWHALGAFRWMWSGHWGLHAVGVAPLSSSRVTGEEGYARITFGLLGGGLTWQPLAESWWTPYIGGGLAGALLHSRGVPSADFTGYSHFIFVACPYVRAGARFLRKGPWRIHFSLLAGISAPHPVLVFDGRTAGAWGRPLLLGTLGVELVAQ